MFSSLPVPFVNMCGIAIIINRAKTLKIINMKTTKFLSVIIAFLLINSCTKKAENPDSLPPDAVLTPDTTYISKDGAGATKTYDYYHELMTYDASTGTWFG